MCHNAMVSYRYSENGVLYRPNVIVYLKVMYIIVKPRLIIFSTSCLKVLVICTFQIQLKLFW